MLPEKNHRRLLQEDERMIAGFVTWARSIRVANMSSVFAPPKRPALVWVSKRTPAPKEGNKFRYNIESAVPRAVKVCVVDM